MVIYSLYISFNLIYNKLPWDMEKKWNYIYILTHVWCSLWARALQQFSTACYHFLNVSEWAASSLLRAQQGLVCRSSSLLSYPAVQLGTQSCRQTDGNSAWHRRFNELLKNKSPLNNAAQPISVDCGLRLTNHKGHFSAAKRSVTAHGSVTVFFAVIVAYEVSWVEACKPRRSKFSE